METRCVPSSDEAPPTSCATRSTPRDGCCAVRSACSSTPRAGTSARRPSALPASRRPSSGARLPSVPRSSCGAPPPGSGRAAGVPREMEAGAEAPRRTLGARPRKPDGLRRHKPQRGLLRLRLRTAPAPPRVQRPPVAGRATMWRRGGPAHSRPRSRHLSRDLRRRPGARRCRPAYRACHATRERRSCAETPDARAGRCCNHCWLASLRCHGYRQAPGGVVWYQSARL